MKIKTFCIITFYGNCYLKFLLFISQQYAVPFNEELYKISRKYLIICNIFLNLGKWWGRSGDYNLRFDRRLWFGQVERQFSWIWYKNV